MNAESTDLVQIQQRSGVQVSEKRVERFLRFALIRVFPMWNG